MSRFLFFFKDFIRFDNSWRFIEVVNTSMVFFLLLRSFVIYECVSIVLRNTEEHQKAGYETEKLELYIPT